MTSEYSPVSICLFREGRRFFVRERNRSRTNVGIQRSLIESLDDALDLSDCAVGLEISSYEKFAGLTEVIGFS